MPLVSSMLYNLWPFESFMPSVGNFKNKRVALIFFLLLLLYSLVKGAK